MNYIKIITFVVKSFFILSLLFVVLSIGITFFYSYEEFTSLLISSYGKTDKLVEFRSGYLTASRFSMLRISLFLILILLIAVLIKLDKVSGFVAVKIASFTNSVYLFWKYLLINYYELSLSKKIFFYCTLILITSIKLYFIPRYFFHIDEITSYIFFVKRGFFVTISYYPNPNNHILYSLIVYLAQPFFSNPFYLLKIPSLLISLFASAILFLFLIKYFNFSVSLLGTLLFSLWGQFFVYSLFGRGYVLMTLFTIIATISVVEIISGKEEKYFWHVYVVSSMLGFYTMIIYFYPFVSLFVLLIVFVFFQKKRSLIKPVIYYNVLVTIGVLLLYTPVFIISGLSALTSNSWIVKPGFLEFISNSPLYMADGFMHILDFDTRRPATVIGLGSIFIATIILIKKKNTVWLLMLLTFFISPVCILLLQQIKPYERIWTYMVFPFCLCLIIILDYLYSLIGNTRFAKGAFLAVVFILITGYTIVKELNATKPNPDGIYYDIARISKYVVAENNGRNIYTNENSYNLYIRYYATMAGINLVPDMSAAPMESNFSYILLIPGSSFPSSIEKNKYVLKEKNMNIEVYKLK